METCRKSPFPLPIKVSHRFYTNLTASLDQNGGPAHCAPLGYANDGGKPVHYCFVAFPNRSLESILLSSKRVGRVETSA